MKTTLLISSAALSFTLTVGDIPAGNSCSDAHEILSASTSFKTFTDNKLSLDDRLSAAKRLSDISSSDEADVLLKIVTDNSEPDAIREAAILNLTRSPYATSSEMIGAINIVLQDEQNEGAQLKRTAFSALQVVKDFSSELPPDDLIVKDLFRKYLKSPVSVVRTQAMSYLSVEKDEEARNVLTNELKNPTGLYAPSEAIKFLAQYGEPEKYVSLVEPYMKDPNTKIRGAATRYLAASDDKKKEVRGIAKNESENIEVREQAIKGLSVHDKAHFSATAQEILADTNTPLLLKNVITKELGLH